MSKRISDTCKVSDVAFFSTGWFCNSPSFHSPTYLLPLEEIWGKVNEHIKKRQNKVVGKISIKKLVEQRKLRSRFLMGTPYNNQARNKSVIINRNIKKAKRILDNVCKGVFPGNYSLE